MLKVLLKKQLTEIFRSYVYDAKTNTARSKAATAAYLLLGLKMPNLNWTNEVTPIKQSACVMLALFGGFAYAALVAVGFMLVGRWSGYVGYMVVCIAVTLLLCAGMLFWLKQKGCRLFAAL